jgi:hypothetical protein
MNQTAQGLAALGRGPDTQLVHMAPSEVNSLQQLAMAHGGSLTINPETGLPEAGFLSSILPMVLGAGAMMIPGLQGFGAAGIATGIGGLQALRTGSLKKGLMAGLGAYGGAGLGSALAGAGVQASVAPQLAQAQAGIGEVASAVPATGLTTPAMVSDYTTNILSKTQPYVDASNAASTAFQNAGPLERLQTMGSGISNLTSGAGRDAFMTQVGGSKGLMQAGMMAAAPMLMDTTTKQPEFKQDASMGQRYQFNAGTQTPTPTPDVPEYGNQGLNFGKERQYFNPMYRPIDNDAARRMYGFASGGPVEAMSNANAIGMNTGYPQADIRTGAYATPYQQPISQNVVTGAQGAGVDPYTGQAQFAEGGEVEGYTYDPVTQMYVKKGGAGATMVSPTGGTSGASAGASGTEDQPLSPQTLAFLDKEAGIPGARDTRMSAINNAATNILGLLSPGSMIARALLDTPFAADMSARMSGYNPADRSYGGASMAEQNAMQAALSSPNTGVGIPGESAAIGEGIGGGDISGQESGTPAIAGGGLLALAQGGISNLGDYSDGGRLLRGPGDGISDSIPAMIGKKQPARLADGEFVVPARIVSELGNGSTEAGARKLYAMMDRVQKARGKTVGKGKVAANSRSAKYLPA